MFNILAEVLNRLKAAGIFTPSYTTLPFPVVTALDTEKGIRP